MAVNMSVGGDRRRAPGALWGKTRFYRAAQNLLTSKGMKLLVLTGGTGQASDAQGRLPGEVQRQGEQSVVAQVLLTSTRFNDKKPSNPRQSCANSYDFYSKCKVSARGMPESMRRAILGLQPPVPFQPDLSRVHQTQPE